MQRSPKALLKAVHVGSPLDTDVCEADSAQQAQDADLEPLPTLPRALQGLLDLHLRTNTLRRPHQHKIFQRISSHLIFELQLKSSCRQSRGPRRKSAPPCRTLCHAVFRADHLLYFKAHSRFFVFRLKLPSCLERPIQENWGSLCHRLCEATVTRLASILLQAESGTDVILNGAVRGRVPAEITGSSCDIRAAEPSSVVAESHASDSMTCKDDCRLGCLSPLAL